MTESFKKFTIIITALIIGYGFSYLVNQSPIKSVQRINYPECVLDCGFSPTDNYNYSDKYGIPITYKTQIVLKNGTILDGNIDYNSLILDNLIFIVAAECIALTYVIIKTKRRKS